MTIDRSAFKASLEAAQRLNEARKRLAEEARIEQQAAAAREERAAAEQLRRRLEERFGAK